MSARSIQYRQFCSALICVCGMAATVRAQVIPGKFIARHGEVVHSVAFSPDGKLLATGTFDHRIHLWDVTTGKEVRQLRGHANRVTSVVFSPDGKSLLSTSSDATLRLWDVATGDVRKTFNGHRSVVLIACFSRDQKAIVSGGEDHTVRIWDAESTELKQTLEGHSAAVAWVALSPDGTTLASAGHDGKIHLWDPQSAMRRRTWTAAPAALQGVAFSPDGTVLASVEGRGTVKLWDPTTGTQIRAFEGHEQGAYAVAFSPTGRTVASSGVDGTVLLRETATGAIRARYRQTGFVRAIAFSPSGRQLATGGQDLHARLWDVTGVLRADGQLPNESLSPPELEKSWHDLGSEQGDLVHRAVWRLVCAPEAVGFLRTRAAMIDAAPTADAAQVERWLVELNDDKFDVRETATKELARLGPAVVPRLRELLNSRPALEVRVRLNRILSNPVRSGDAFRLLRAIEVLEETRTSEALELAAKLRQQAT